MLKFLFDYFAVAFIFVFVFAITAYICTALDLLNTPEMASASVVLGGSAALAYLVFWVGVGSAGPDPIPTAANDAENGDLADYPMNGHEFESWVAAKLVFYGWKADVTRGSGDQGVDVIAARFGKQVGIQCKRFTGSVGNGAVQEALSGKQFYRLNYAVVISTGNYTKSAKALALRSGVVLAGVKDIPTLHEILALENAYRSSSW